MSRGDFSRPLKSVFKYVKKGESKLAATEKRDFMKDLNELKKKVFFDLLHLAGRVFIMVQYSENVIIGKRGFLEEEKKNGLILVFNTKMNFTWDEDFIEAKLAFGTTPQKCIIPVDNIVVIYSPEIQTQFATAYQPGEKEKVASDKTDAERKEAGEKVLKVDFSKKRQKK